MQSGVNYQTLLQLGVGLNFAIGAYGPYRKEYEERIRSKLDEARERLNELLSRDDSQFSSPRTDLQSLPIRHLSDRELHRYLSDVTIRFYRRRQVYDRGDKFLDGLLVPIGLISLLLLCYASFWPKTQIRNWAAYSICFLILVPSTVALARVVLEIRNHERFYRKESNLTHLKTSQQRQDDRMRSLPTQGEITRVMNEARLRYRKYAARSER